MYSWAARYDSVTHVQLCSELNANQSANIALLALSHCPCEIFSYLQSGYFLKSDFAGHISSRAGPGGEA